MTPSRQPSVTLDRETIDAIAERAAQRTVELLRQPPGEQSMPQLVDAATVARALGVSRDCVYAHADALGGKRIGSGARGRLRFDLDRTLAAWTSRSESERSPEREIPAQTQVSRRARPRRLGSGPKLLPIRGVADRPNGHEGRL
jgi:hypothetical protein